jgi:hypothetical protein
MTGRCLSVSKGCAMKERVFFAKEHGHMKEEFKAFASTSRLYQLRYVYML